MRILRFNFCRGSTRYSVDKCSKVMGKDVVYVAKRKENQLFTIVVAEIRTVDQEERGPYVGRSTYYDHLDQIHPSSKSEVVCE